MIRSRVLPRGVRAGVSFGGPVVCVLLSVGAATAQETASDRPDPLTLSALEGLRVPSEVRVSPDGTAVLLRLLVPHEEGIGWRGEIWKLGREGAGPVRLLEGGRVRWSPDGRRFAYIARGEGGRQLRLARPDGSGERVLTRAIGGVRDYAWAPDRARIAYVASVDGIDQLFVQATADSTARQITGVSESVHVDSASGAIRDVGRAVDAAFLDVPGDPVWSADGSEVYFHGAAGVERRLQALNVENGEVRPLVANGGVVARTSFSRDRRTATFLGSTVDRPYDAYRVDLGGGPAPEAASAPRRLTRLNPDIEELDAGEMETFGWKNDEGRSLEGLLISPRPVEEPVAQHAPPPVIVWLHGGPEGHAVRAFDPTLPFPGVPFDPFPLRVMAARGYAVFLPNFRGSAGYGESFRRSAVGRPARLAAADVLSGLQALGDSGRIDPGRIGAVGWASGAFKVANLLVRSDRFRAAAFGAGHTEVHAAVGEGDAVIQWRSLYGGLPWEVPERYRAESPLLHSSRIDTPTLLIHGASDPLVPAE